MAEPRILRFRTPPSLWPAYARVLLARKPACLPEGVELPRIEAVLSGFTVDRARLARYRAVCGIPDSDELPIAFPHLLAMPMHLAMLASDAFPVRLPGLIHVRHRIVQRRPLRIEDSGEIRTWIEGHRETDRGQEFDLHTEVHVDGTALWSEVCTFLARRKRAAGVRRKASAPAAGPAASPDGAPVRASTLRAEADVGRRYAAVSGDFNPIHIFALAARPFGFERAIAHGMWSLARCLAELSDTMCEAPRQLDVTFRAPILLPGAALLRAWRIENGQAFALSDTQGRRQHLTGTLTASA